MKNHSEILAFPLDSPPPSKSPSPSQLKRLRKQERKLKGERCLVITPAEGGLIIGELTTGKLSQVLRRAAR